MITKQTYRLFIKIVGEDSLEIKPLSKHLFTKILIKWTALQTPEGFIVTDHLRLKNITFGINAPKQWVSKIGVNKFRVFCSASNLLTWAAYDMYDPEVPTGGSAYFDMPPLKTLTFGIDINF